MNTGKSKLHRAQGVEQLDDVGASALAVLLALVRGPQAPGAAPSQCRVVTVDFICDVYTVCAHDSRISG